MTFDKITDFMDLMVRWIFPTKYILQRMEIVKLNVAGEQVEEAFLTHLQNVFVSFILCVRIVRCTGEDNRI